MYGGMYPKHIVDDEGDQVVKPLTITKRPTNKYQNPTHQ